jgi:hypothetical protein
MSAAESKKDSAFLLMSINKIKKNNKMVLTFSIGCDKILSVVKHKTQ